MAGGVLNIQKDDLDKPDAVDPGPAYPGYRQRRDEPPRTRLPAQAWLLLIGGAFLALAFLLWMLYRFAARWSDAHPDLIDLFGSLLWAGAMLVVGAGVIGMVLYGHAKIDAARHRAKRELIIRDRADNPVNLEVLMDQAVALAIWQAQFQAAQQAEVLMAAARPHPFVKTLTGGDHQETNTNIDAVGAGDEPPPALPPPIVNLDSFPPLDSPTAVPLGMSGTDPISLDFGKDTLHVGLYGASGAGKDNLLRAWFMALTRRNTPDQVCFAVLDGKGDWLTADLAQLAHMWMPPAGGVGQHGAGLMKSGIERIEAELGRRMQLINSAGCRTREAYAQRTGATLPLLIVYVTDGVTAVEGALTGLMNDLVSKARAAGIRVVVSMQTPTGQDMRWRLNLSTYISGHLPHPSQDLVALGLTKGELVDLRPSQLPTPEQERGLFIVRQGAMVKKIKAVFVSDETFDGYVGRLARRTTPLPDTRSPKQAWLDDTRRTLEHEPRETRLKAARYFAGIGFGQREIAYLCRLSDETAGAIWRAAKSNGNGVRV